MKIVSVADIKSQFSAFLKASERGPIVVTRNGKPVAALVSVQDEDEDEDELERLLMAHSPRLQAILNESRRQIRQGDVLSHDEFWQEVERAEPAKQRTKKRKARSA